MKTYLIMPAYNEERRIGETLDAYCNYFLINYLENFNPVRIIVAINNTTDRTEEIVKKYEKDYPFLRHITLPGKGKDYAIIEGWKEALKTAKPENFIGFVDADNATPPEALNDLIKGLYNDIEIHGAIASRYIPGAIVNPRQTWKRIVVSRIFNLLVKCVLFLPYKDTQCGAKIFRRDAVSAIINDLGVTKWAFDVDLLFRLKKKKFKIKEFPTLWADKQYSKINLMEAGPRMAWAVLKLRLCG